MNKKAIAILGAIFLLIVGTLGFLIISRMGGDKDNNTTPITQGKDPEETENPEDETTTTTEPESTTTTLPPQENRIKMYKLTEDQVLSPVLFYKGDGVTYFDRQGQLYMSSMEEKDGRLQVTQVKKLEIEKKEGITKILWPKKGDDFIAETKFSSGLKSWSYYNSKTGMYTDLPEQIISLDWMPEGNKVLYVWLENGKATLNMSDPDSKNWKEISELWEQDNAISISPDGLNILYYQTANSKSDNAINLTTPDGKLWKGLVKEGYNYGVLWSPDSKKFLFAKKDRNSQKYQLWHYDLLASEAKNLGLFTTVDKAVWAKDNNTVIASVPLTGTIGENTLTVDKIYKMDTSKLEKLEYELPENTPVDGRDLFVSKESDKVFFRNAQDGMLYYLDLSSPTVTGGLR